MTEHPQTPAPLPADLGGLTVLVVEDHAIGRILLEAMLGGLGVAARLAGTGEEARAAIAGERFDAVLIDLGLPDVHGEDLAGALIRLAPAPAPPMIAVTGRERPPRLPGVFVDWLEKPFSVRDLHRLLASATDRSRRSA
jgi:CheY-like chemotaxis protein